MKCVNLDFHTSPLIEGIGEKFDAKKFAQTLKNAHVDSINLFSKCHHGHTYYPSKVSSMHPKLKFNLLKEQIDACREVGIKTPIYVTVGWSAKDADEHPEWNQINFFTKKTDYMGIPADEGADAETPLRHCVWKALCPIGPYGDYMEALTREICESFDVSDGMFFDICFWNDHCICEHCKKSMVEMGLDPENFEDVKKHYVIGHRAFAKRMTDVVHEYAKDAPVFFNGGGANMNRPEYNDCHTYFSLEDLPTAWGGYDLMPVRAKYFERFGLMYQGMTGKFHHAWGEFGGFKNKEALRYECADMLSVGAEPAVGDHLHPSGEIDESTYAIIGHAFEYAGKIEKYSENTRTYTDLALWVGHNSDSDLGASKIIQMMHLDFDVVKGGDDISKYNCMILPDRIKFSDEDKAALLAFTARGGKIIASYESIFDELGIKKIAPSTADNDFIRCDVEDFVTPFLSYSSAYKVESDGEVMAEVFEPYFNRTVGHYCGHKNTPYKTEPAEYPALVRRGNVLYFAHPVFEAYNKSGNYVLERYIIQAIESIYDKPIITEELPSCARVRIRESKNEGFLALHVLYAPPVNRGNVCLLPDFPKLHDVKVTIKVDREISTAISEPDGEAIPFTKDGDKITLSLPPFRLHKLIILK